MEREWISLEGTEFVIKKTVKKRMKDHWDQNKFKHQMTCGLHDDDADRENYRRRHHQEKG